MRTYFAVGSADGGGASAALNTVRVHRARAAVHAVVLAAEAVVTDACGTLASILVDDEIVFADARKF